MEISNLSDAEFKTMVIRMFKERTVYFKIIKMNQAEKKFTLSKMNKNLH